jgi:hypothetical protein
MSVKPILHPFFVRASAFALFMASASPVIAGGPTDPPPPTSPPPFAQIKDCPPGDEAACAYAAELIDIENGEIENESKGLGKAGNYALCYTNYNMAQMYQAQRWKANYLALKAKGDKNAEIDAAQSLINTGRVILNHLQSCLALRAPRRAW